jgi:death-on-curing protein
LRSALAQPEASFGGEFLHRDLYEMAAAYLFHLTQNHPFIDGNKRIGLAAAVAFLHINGQALTAGQPAAVQLVLAVARGELDKPAIAAFFRKHSRPR